MAARKSTADLVALLRRRFFRSTLQPIAENLEYNPASIAARYRANYLGSISLPSVQQAGLSTAPDKPTRDTGKTSPHDDAPANENTVPPVGSQDKQSGGKASKVVSSHSSYCLACLRSSAVGMRDRHRFGSKNLFLQRTFAVEHFGSFTEPTQRLSLPFFLA